MNPVKEPRQRLAFPVREVPGPGQGETPPPPLPPQAAIPEEALSAANASQQPPSPKLAGLARCSETAFAPNGLYQGENKTLESFQSGVVIAARSRSGRSPLVAPHRAPSGVQARPQNQQAVAADPQLNVPALALPFPTGVRAGAIQQVLARRQQLHFHQKMFCCKIWPHSSCK